MVDVLPDVTVTWTPHAIFTRFTEIPEKPEKRPVK
jgi:hypothetical protein